MVTPLHVLILEDRPTDAELMLRTLRQSEFDPTWQRVETEAEYLAHLHANLDVILADYSLPSLMPCERCVGCRSMAWTCHSLL